MDSMDIDNSLDEFKHFLRRIKEKYPFRTQNNASILTQLDKLKTKANEVVRDIEQKTKLIEEEEELKNLPNSSDSSFLQLRAILINFQKLIQIIQQVQHCTDRSTRLVSILLIPSSLQLSDRWQRESI
jgi:hypothetical protein